MTVLDLPYGFTAELLEVEEEAEVPRCDSSHADSHYHECWRCRDGWIHDDDIGGCVGVQMRTCPACEESGDVEPWYAHGRRPL